MLTGALIGGAIGWVVWRLYAWGQPARQDSVPTTDATPAKAMPKEGLIAFVFVGWAVFAVSLAGLWIYGSISLFLQQRLIECAVATLLPPLAVGYGLVRLLGVW